MARSKETYKSNNATKTYLLKLLVNIIPVNLSKKHHQTKNLRLHPIDKLTRTQLRRMQNALKKNQEQSIQFMEKAFEKMDEDVSIDLYSDEKQVLTDAIEVKEKLIRTCSHNTSQKLSLL
eukprot:NODE_534_length_6366_cov_0.490825.p6 type:complete len:120 gc:universal NODE_534_length_6366_cov_0.490825:5497-5856(+)